MKKMITLILFHLMFFSAFVFSSDAEEILISALKQSLTEGTCLSATEDIAYISWMTQVEEQIFDPNIKYDGKDVTINYLRTKNNDYAKLEYPIFSMSSDVTKGLIRFYTRNFSYYFNESLMTKPGKFVNSSYTTLADGQIRLKENYFVKSMEEDTIRERPTWKITIANSFSGSMMTFWIDKEQNVRLREDYFEKFPLLSQRIEYLSYQQLSDGTLVEKEYYIWGHNYPGYIF